MKKIWTKALAYMLAATMCFSAANVSVYAQERTIAEVSKETATMNEVVAKDANVLKNHSESATDANAGSTWNQVTTENVFEGENYKITFILTSNWDTGYNANIKIENTGDSIIENWYLEFESKNKITNIWNAEISENVESEYKIKNAGWNQDISAQECVEFGVSGEGAFEGFPETYELVSAISEIKEEDYLIEYTVDSDWGSGFTGNIKITNNTKSLIEDWVLEFDFDRNITNLWNGIIEKHEGNHYVIKNAGHNANIAAGQTISFGFNGCEGTLENEPNAYLLYSYNSNKEIDLKLDTDNDGVADYIEEYLGTDKLKEDTDGDGLSDYIELYSFVLDPLSHDTDNDGISDANEDIDEDGLTNIYEVSIGTSIIIEDTDEDGLNDADENNIYGTNPLEADTDGDGASDSKEIEYGTNPLVYEASFEVTENATNEDTVKVSVDIILAGRFISS